MSDRGFSGSAALTLTPFIGRGREVGTTRRLLGDGQRLLTLTGPAGVGKTRLALVVAASSADLYPDGYRFVSLAPILEPELVAGLVAAAFDISHRDTHELLPAISASIGPQRVLLVLDNFEHLLSAAHLITDLLVACPGLSVLVTSRSPLHILGEHLLPVPMLSLPTRTGADEMEALASAEAVQLFVIRARAACGEFDLTAQNAATVGEICRKLDGLPLAIELAAARLRVLSPVALLERLQGGLPVLVGGTRDAPSRLRTMGDAIAWSYDLLTPGQAALFRRLGMFAGGWTLNAVEAICMADIDEFDALEGVAALLDQSLIRRAVQEGAGPRFEMLHVVREYALQQLVATGEEASLRRAHAEYFRQLAERAGATRGTEQQRLHALVTEEFNNIRVVLGWALSEGRDPADVDVALGLLGDLWFYWLHRSRAPGEARLWLTRTLDIAPAAGTPSRGKALAALGAIEWRQGDYESAWQHLEQSVQIFSELGEGRGLADALHLAGHVRFEASEYAAAHALYQRSQAAYTEVGDLLGGLPLTGDLGMVAYHQGNYDAALSLFEECLRRCRQHGITDHAADSLNRLGDLARLAGDLDRAQNLYSESLVLWQSVHGTPGIASGLHKLGQTVRRRGDATEARRLVVESLTLQEELGNKQGIVECLAALAGLAFESASPERAVELIGASDAALAELGAPLAPADAADLERDRTRGRASLDARTWAAADRRGREMSVAQALVLAQAAPPAGGTNTDGEPSGVLSPREAEVAELIAKGLSNRELAAALTISEKTAANHVEHIMTKLNFRSRTQIAVWAVRNR